MFGSSRVDSRYRSQHIVVLLLLSTTSVKVSMQQRHVSAAMQSSLDEGGILPPSLLPIARSLRVDDEGADDAAAAPPSRVCKLYLTAGSFTAPPSMVIGEAWLPWNLYGSTPSATTVQSSRGDGSSSSALALGSSNNKATTLDGAGDDRSSSMMPPSDAAYQASSAQQRSCAPHTMILPSSMEGQVAPAEQATLTGAAIAAADCVPFKWLALSAVCTLLTQPPTAVIIVGDSVSRHLFLGLQVGAPSQRRYKGERAVG